MATGFTFTSADEATAAAARNLAVRLRVGRAMTAVGCFVVIAAEEQIVVTVSEIVGDEADVMAVSMEVDDTTCADDEIKAVSATMATPFEQVVPGPLAVVDLEAS